MKKLFSILLTVLSASLLPAQNGGIEVKDRPAVASRGKISAGENIARLAAPMVFGGAPILESMLVKKGEAVERGQVVAILKGRERAQAALDSAKAALESVKTESEIRIQQQRNEVADLVGTFAQNADVLTKKSPPRSERERIEYEQETITRRLDQASIMLKLVEKNEANVVARAEASVKEARLVLEDLTVRTPISGEVIEIHAKPGEAIGNEGICEIADTNIMYVNAEVYISDIKRVNIGDEAECIPEALPSEVLKGKVVEISRYVETNKIFTQDPGEYVDMKVINVKIGLEDPTKVKKLIGSLVRVKIFVKE